MTMRARLLLLACLRRPVLDQVGVREEVGGLLRAFDQLLQRLGLGLGLGLGVRLGLGWGLGWGLVLGPGSASPHPNLALTWRDSIGRVLVLSFSCLRSVGGHLSGESGTYTTHECDRHGAIGPWLRA